jgi:hypothetical protein
MNAARAGAESPAGGCTGTGAWAINGPMALSSADFRGTRVLRDSIEVNLG